MTKEEFKSLMTQAGYKKKHELAKELGISYQAVNNWGNGADYPKWLESFFYYYIRAKELEKKLESTK